MYFPLEQGQKETSSNSTEPSLSSVPAPPQIIDTLDKWVLVLVPEGAFSLSIFLDGGPWSYKIWVVSRS